MTPSPFPDWITSPTADALVTEALATLTNLITGEQFTVQAGDYTVKVAASDDNNTPSTEPNMPVATPETDPAPSDIYIASATISTVDDYENIGQPFWDPTYLRSALKIIQRGV